MDFNKKWQSSGKLDFSATDSAPIHFDITASNSLHWPLSTALITPVINVLAASELSPVVNNGTVEILTPIFANHELDAPITAHEFDFDINVNRDVKNKISSHSNPAKLANAAIISQFSDSPALSTMFNQLIQPGKPLQLSIAALQAQLPKQSASNVLWQRDGQIQQSSVTHFNHLLIDGFATIDSRWIDGIDVGNQVTTQYKYPPRADCEKATYWQETDDLRHHVVDDFSNGVAIRKQWLNNFENAILPTAQRPPVIIPPPELPEISPPLLDFKSIWNNSGELDFFRIELDALIVMNEIDIYIVADNGEKTAIHPINSTLDFDRDSFVWSFSGQLFGANNLVLLTHRAKFEINVNGHKLLFTLREFNKANSFANDEYRFTCVTNSQWLGHPYASLHNGTVDNPIGAWQLVAEKFTTENFTLNRKQTPEWTLEKDSFSYLNKSAIELAIQVAEASGAMLQPDLINDIIHVQPRYKVSPWNWNALSDEECDHVINADYIDTQSSSDNTTPQLNSVLIGGETHGVITEAVKGGTAGDVRAKDVISPLSQDHNVNAELARNIMADSGEQEVLGLAVPLLPPDSAFGLMLPGEIVRVIYPEKTITGLCISNSVPLQSITDVMQSVSLELNNGYN